MVTSILQVFHLYLYVLSDLGDTLFFVSPYIDLILASTLAEPYLVSTLVDTSIIARLVGKNYPVIVS